MSASASRFGNRNIRSLGLRIDPNERDDVFFDCTENFSYLENLKTAVEVEEEWVAAALGSLPAQVEHVENLALTVLQRTVKVLDNLCDLSSEMSAKFKVAMESETVASRMSMLLDLSEVVAVSNRSTDAWLHLSGLVTAGEGFQPIKIVKDCVCALGGARLSGNQLLPIYHRRGMN